MCPGATHELSLDDSLFAMTPSLGKQSLLAAHRRNLLKIFHAALGAVQGRACVRRALANGDAGEAIYVVAIGKAAASMYLGAWEALGEGIRGALLITKYGHLPAKLPGPVHAMQAGHPLPDDGSLSAGEALLSFLDTAPDDARLLFLISGGASALVEVLPEGLSLGDLERINAWLLGAGLDIHVMNWVRKRISRIKAGRLAGWLRGRATLNLVISDVPGNDPAVIGSGLLVAGGAQHEPEVAWPPWLAAMLHLAETAPTPGDDSFNTVETRVIATLDHAREAAASEARELGYDVFLHPDDFACDAQATGRRLATELIDGPPLLHVWGGETNTVLPARPGRGGRNQHLALAAAEVLAGREDVSLLAAGTDGSDGPTEDAGGLVDGGTLARGRARGFEAADCLARADSGSLLAASGDLVNTGPTGTNVMDLVLGLKFVSDD